MRIPMVMVAALLSTSCELNRTAPEDFTEMKRPVVPDDPDKRGGGLPLFEKERAACVDRINAFRATEGRPPLRRWTEAETCSDGEAESDAASGDPHGAFGRCKETAQNECPGWASLESTVQGCLQSMWDERLNPGGEQGHYQNIRNTRHTMVACGFHVLPNGRVWALQNFR